MVGLAGLEPATLGFEGRCSIQLNYRPGNSITKDGNFYCLNRRAIIAKAYRLSKRIKHANLSFLTKDSKGISRLKTGPIRLNKGIRHSFCLSCLDIDTNPSCFGSHQRQTITFPSNLIMTFD